MRLIYLFFVCTLFHSFQLLAEEEDSAVIPPGKIFYEDYYALNDVVEISGTIKGNVYLAGTQVSIDGVIEGNLFVLAGNLEITGKVHGNIWALAGGITMAGEAQQDAVLLAANADLVKGGGINGNLTLFAGNANIENWIGGSATALSSHLKVSGEIDHNLRGFAGKLRILPTARIKGDLKYKSNEAAIIDPHAQIGGKILFHRSFFKDLIDVPVIRGLIIGSKVAAFLMNFMYTFVMGWIIIRLFPRKLSRTLTSLQEDPLKSFLHGLILLVLFPLVSLILLATVIGAPFALTLIALNIVTFYTAKIFTILWMGNWLFSHWRWKTNGMATLTCSQIIYCILVAVPYLGTFFAFLAMIFGLGAIAVAQKN